MRPQHRKAIEAIHDEAWYTIRAGEDWETTYAKTPDQFKTLIKSENRLLRGLRVYFAEVAGRALQLVDWQTYRQQVVKAYDVTVTTDPTAWQAEEQLLFQVIFNDMVILVATGAAASEVLYEIPAGISTSQNFVLEAAKNLTRSVAYSLTETTRKKVIASIEASLALGESMADAKARLSFLNDPKRAEMIARTESVRAYNEGVISYGNMTGAQYKTWRTVNDPCKVCQSVLTLNETNGRAGTVGINEPFKSIVGNVFKPSDTHPRCRCGIRLRYPVDQPVNEFGQTITLDEAKRRIRDDSGTSLTL